MMPKAARARVPPYLRRGRADCRWSRNITPAGSWAVTSAASERSGGIPRRNLYRGVWCDNMTPNGCDTSGTTKWEGDKLVGTMEGDMNGQKMVTRFTYSDFKPDSFVMTMEMGPDASKLQKAMTITYTKASMAEKKM